MFFLRKGCKESISGLIQVVFLATKIPVTKENARLSL